MSKLTFAVKKSNFHSKTCGGNYATIQDENWANCWNDI
jgi:hypothetical protein